MAWGGRNGARAFCGAVTEEAEVKKTNEKLTFRSVCTTFSLLRSLKLGCVSEKPK
jgi:hypothetical protein